jgi:hypothetical protein
MSHCSSVTLPVDGFRKSAHLNGSCTYPDLSDVFVRHSVTEEVLALLDEIEEY